MMKAIPFPTIHNGNPDEDNHHCQNEKPAVHRRRIKMVCFNFNFLVYFSFHTMFSFSGRTKGMERGSCPFLHGTGDQNDVDHTPTKKKNTGR